jgi:predicted RNA binding protein YcfA (HicA-like mRNA interferase family)
MIRILNKRGFALSRSTGSHHIFKDAAGSRVTVAVHAGKIIHPKVLQSILNDMDLSVDELKELL